TSFLPQIHELRPLRGQKAAAANVLRLLEGSAIIEAHRWCDKVQDAYSLRCAAQVHGACRDLLEYAEYTASVELNAATDNPRGLPYASCRRGCATTGRSPETSRPWPRRSATVPSSRRWRRQRGCWSESHRNPGGARRRARR